MDGWMVQRNSQVLVINLLLCKILIFILEVELICLYNSE